MIIIDGAPQFSLDIQEWQSWLHTLTTDSFFVINKEDESVVAEINHTLKRIELLENLALEEATCPKWVKKLNEEANIDALDYTFEQTKKASQ